MNSKLVPGTMIKVVKLANKESHLNPGDIGIVKAISNKISLPGDSPFWQVSVEWLTTKSSLMIILPEDEIKII